MSAIDTLGSRPNPSASTDAFSSLTSGQFLKIIFTELTNQDPLAPNDTQAMLNQLSTLRSIESDTKMVDSLGRLVSQNEFAAASSLIGSLVSGITLDNRRVSDLVVSVSMTQDGPVLNMFDGSRMFFRNVDEIVGPIDGFGDPDDPPPPIDDKDDDDQNDGPPPPGDGSAPTPQIGRPDYGGLTPGQKTNYQSKPVLKTVSSDV